MTKIKMKMTSLLSIAVLGTVLLAQSPPASLETDIPRFMEAGMIPGLSIAVIDGSKTWTHAFGVASAQTKQATTPETIFQAGSLSKPAFAYAVLKLAEAGKLDLDAPLSQYPPQPHIENSNKLNPI